MREAAEVYVRFTVIEKMPRVTAKEQLVFANGWKLRERKKSPSSREPGRAKVEEVPRAAAQN